MHFSKAEKVLHDNNKFNPPPGYYSANDALDSFSNKQQKIINNQSFTRQHRFDSDSKGAYEDSPGPGSYFNDRANRIKKRMIDEVKKKENSNLSNNFEKFQGQSEIKISSIPSIPKKSATRVYQQLAPGILILHQEQNEGSNIGPGSYLVKENLIKKKPIAHKINPEPKKKKNYIQEQPEIIVPKIADQIRQERRQMQRKKLIKSSGINKSMISPSDLCLQVIILRQKLLRSDDNPPPGYYYNEKYQTSFKDIQPDLLPQYQLFMGKQQRFKEKEGINLGPGQYDAEEDIRKNAGGFIPKQQRKMYSDSNKMVPGPGSYKIQYNKQQASDPKGSYPPIFGSGCNRFYSVDKKSQTTTPGPGSYKVDIPKKKKQKYIKVKRNLYDSQITKPQKLQNQQLISMGGDRGRSMQNYYRKNNHDKTSHVFTSKVQRFTQKQKFCETGPGVYEINSSSLNKTSFNKNKNGYIGQKQPRFDDTMVRPNIGPGTYNKL